MAHTTVAHTDMETKTSPPLGMVIGTSYAKLKNDIAVVSTPIVSPPDRETVGNATKFDKNTPTLNVALNSPTKVQAHCHMSSNSMCGLARVDLVLDSREFTSKESTVPLAWGRKFHGMRWCTIETILYIYIYI
jgi:hypothetical protein